MTNYETIIIGGSYAGLSAGMALGRSLRRVLIIDSGKPCNRQTPHAQNFLTHDGESPAQIAKEARKDVAKYDSVEIYRDLAVDGERNDYGFTITTAGGKRFAGKRLIFASGVKDIMPDLPGFAECWGISVIHCPYCHGYEVRQKKTGILANGDAAVHYARLIRNWTHDLTLFTNGPSTLTAEQTAAIQKNDISIVETEVTALQHDDGHLRQLVLADQSTFPLRALYSSPAYEQHCTIPEQLGCTLTERKLLQVDPFQKTTVPNVYACGDCASPFRALSYAIATGTIAGATVNYGLTEEEF